MSKVSKAFKALNGLSDEEKLELEDLFKEEDVKEEPKKEEPKVEPKKEEPKVEVKEEETEIEKLFKKMNEKISTLTNTVEKMKPFGAKQKQQTSKDASEFDDMFANLRSKQRS
jgi:outer membrane biosynthesis protein TonB